MSFLKNALKIGLAKKAIDIARRPENQRKLKEVATSVKNGVANRGKGGSGGSGPR